MLNWGEIKTVATYSLCRDFAPSVNINPYSCPSYPIDCFSLSILVSFQIYMHVGIKVPKELSRIDRGKMGWFQNREILKDRCPISLYADSRTHLQEATPNFPASQGPARTDNLGITWWDRTEIALSANFLANQFLLRSSGIIAPFTCIATEGEDIIQPREIRSALNWTLSILSRLVFDVFAYKMLP